jgi:parallel beta-helix repeat protein
MGLFDWPVLARATVMLGIMLLDPLASAAKECGDVVACACGDSVRGSTRLDRDLVGCRTGLRVKDQATLECAGHVVSGNGDGEGIVVEGRGAVVRGCSVSGFRTGIRLRAGGGHLIEGNDVVGNARYGIELAAATAGNRIVDNVVLASGDEGIHVGTGADANVVAGNEIADSGKENLYLLDVEGCTVAGNRLAGGGAAAIYVKHAAGNLFAGNEVEDRPIQLRGESDGNAFEDNVLRGAGFLLQAYRDSKRGWKAPRDNEVRGGAVLGTKTCFRFDGAADNTVTGVRVDGCTAMAQKRSGGLAPTGNAVDVVRE